MTLQRQRRTLKRKQSHSYDGNGASDDNNGEHAKNVCFLFDCI